MNLLSYPLTSMEDFRDYRRMCSAEEWKRDREYVSDLASYARNRASYDTLIRYLLRMKQYKGGKTLVEGLCRSWIAMYPSRKVMVSELERCLKGVKSL